MAVKRRTILAIFVVAHVINDFYATVLPAFLPAIADEFDLDYTELGVLSFAFILLTGVLQPVFGAAADRAGRRRWLLVFGFGAGACGFVAMAVAPSYWFIVVVSLLCGLGAATYHPQATAFIVSAYPERRGRMLGIHGWGGSGGHFLAPAVVVFGVAAFGWRPTMGLIAVPLLVAGLLLRVGLDETPPNPTTTLRATAGMPLLLLALTFGFSAIIGRSFLTFFVKMLVDEGWQETDAGVLLTVILLTGAVAQPLGGWFYDRLGGRQVFTVALAAISALVLVFGFTDGPTSLVAVAGITFFQFSLFPVGLAQASQLAPASQTGGATGLVFGITGLMTATAQPVVGGLAEAVGDIRVALAWLFPLGLIGLALARRIPERATEIMVGSTGSRPT